MTTDNKKKTIVHVITGLNDGGAEAALHRLIAAENEEFHVVISLLDGGKYREVLENEGFQVHSIGMARGKPSLSALFKIVKLIRRIKPDLVQTWMYHANLLGGVGARIAGVKNVVWGIHNTTLDKKTSSPLTLKVNRLSALISGFVPRKIICCAATSKTVHDETGYDSSKTVIVHNGYDVEKFRIDNEARNKIRAEMNLDANVLVLGTVARFDPQKDFPNIISTLAVLKRRGHVFRAILIGQNVDRENADLVRLCEQAGVQGEVLLIGRRPDIPSIMNALDIHILGSSYGEAFPNVICEAMACGTPVAATDVGDCRLIIGNTGAIAPPRNPSALADAVEKLLLHRASGSMSNRVRSQIVDNFSLDLMVAGYKNVWSTCFTNQEPEHH